MTTPLLIGLGVAGMALGGRAIIRVAKELKSGSVLKRYYDGGFESAMTKREAALVLGCRESSPKDRVMERYRTLMRLNHPDAQGSPYVAAKINEAKELLVKNAANEAKS